MPEDEAWCANTFPGIKIDTPVTVYSLIHWTIPTGNRDIRRE
jgi:hypothetical protein